MNFVSTPLAGSYLIELKAISDDRGWFARYFCKNEFNTIGHDREWVQMNHSFNSKKGTLRGMHFQLAPHKEIKLVRCVAGAVFDVIVDIRKGSPSFLHWYGTILSAENRNMLYIPEGFAHGFQCLSDNSELLYHHTGFYNPLAESGIRYNDPSIQIKWPLDISVISGKDAGHPYIDKDFKGI